MDLRNQQTGVTQVGGITAYRQEDTSVSAAVTTCGRNRSGERRALREGKWMDDYQT